MCTTPVMSPYTSVKDDEHICLTKKKLWIPINDIKKISDKILLYSFVMHLSGKNASHPRVQ